MAIKEVPEVKAKSRPVIIDCLRKYLEKSYDEEITEITIEIKIDGITEKENISTHTLCLPKS